MPTLPGSSVVACMEPNRCAVVVTESSARRAGAGGRAGAQGRAVTSADSRTHSPSRCSSSGIDSPVRQSPPHMSSGDSRRCTRLGKQETRARRASAPCAASTVGRVGSSGSAPKLLRESQQRACLSHTSHRWRAGRVHGARREGAGARLCSCRATAQSPSARGAEQGGGGRVRREERLHRGCYQHCPTGAAAPERHP